MTLGIRKLIVVSLVGGVVLFANFLLVAHWLQEKGVIDMAQHVRQEFLTGTAITIIVVLLILLVRPGYSSARVWAATRRCPVCDCSVREGGRYCGECGSRI
jgi:hypothetical protein